MQYLLTETEYNDLQTRAKQVVRDNTDQLQKFCTMVADTMPVKFWGNEEARIWHCILTVKSEHYCDECPCVSKDFKTPDICPYPYKEWSK